MKTPTLLIVAVASLAGCDTYGYGPGGYGPSGYGPGGYGPSGYGPSGYGQVAPAAAMSLTTANKAPFGTYLVDSSGRAVYVLDGTQGQNAAYRCAGDCPSTWPPMLTAGPPVAAAGVNAAMLATIPSYGGAQATYAGWPLYYFSHDAAPGDTMGQGVHDGWGMWYLLSPSGAPIRPTGGY